MTLRARSSLTESKYRELLPTQPRLIVVDLETTGLSPNHDFIIEIGAVELVNLEAQRAFRHLACPPKKLPEHIAQLTGLSMQDLRGFPPPAVAVTAFLQWVGPIHDVAIVGHNIAFDLSFLIAEVYRINAGTGNNWELPQASFCTYTFIRTAFYGRTLDLDKACRLFGVKTSKSAVRHRAVADCSLTHRLLHALWHWDYFHDSPHLQVNTTSCQLPAQSGDRKLPWDKS